MKSAVPNTDDEIEVVTVAGESRWGRIRIRERQGYTREKCSIYLTPEQLEEHAAACLALSVMLTAGPEESLEQRHQYHERMYLHHYTCATATGRAVKLVPELSEVDRLRTMVEAMRPIVDAASTLLTYVPRYNASSVVNASLDVIAANRARATAALAGMPPLCPQCGESPCNGDVHARGWRRDD